MGFVVTSLVASSADSFCALWTTRREARVRGHLIDGALSYYHICVNTYMYKAFLKMFFGSVLDVLFF